MEAANTLQADLIGVDLLPDGVGRWMVLELNGAADFTQAYNLNGEDVHERAIQALLCSPTRNQPLASLGDVHRELAA